MIPFWLVYSTMYFTHNIVYDYRIFTEIQVYFNTPGFYINF